VTTNQFCHCFHRKGKPGWLVWELSESEMSVEACGMLIDRIHDNRRGGNL
jgi:hypothetical protein